MENDTNLGSYEPTLDDGLQIKDSFSQYIYLLVIFFCAQFSLFPGMAIIIGIEDVAIAYSKGAFFYPELKVQQLIFSITYYHILLIIPFYIFFKSITKIFLSKNKVILYKGIFFLKTRKEFYFDGIEIIPAKGGVIIYLYLKGKKTRLDVSPSSSGYTNLEKFAKEHGIEWPEDDY